MVRCFWDNVSCPEGLYGTVKRHRNCKHQGSWALGLDGMANISELLINVVNTNKPKVLSGLNQKVQGWKMC